MNTVPSIDIVCTGTDATPHERWYIANFAYRPPRKGGGGQADGWVLYGYRSVYRNRGGGKWKKVRTPQVVPNTGGYHLDCKRCPVFVKAKAATLDPVLDDALERGMSSLPLYDIAAKLSGNAV